MTTIHFTRFILAIACLLSGPALAQTMYKCLEGGKPVYADRPCGKSAVELDLHVAPAAPQEAAERLAREKAFLAEVEGERAAEDRRIARAAVQAQRVQRELALQRRHCDKLRLQAKWAGEDSRQLSREEQAKARIKARRQAEALAVECPA